MTLEEALEIIEERTIFYEPEEGEAMEVLCKAAKKQIAVKPKLYYDAAGNLIGRCGNCSNLLPLYGEMFCPACGQAIDWSSDKE